MGSNEDGSALHLGDRINSEIKDHDYPLYYIFKWNFYKSFKDACYYNNL